MKSFDVAAVVTGGASGLGEATTRALAAEGAAVTILDLNEDRGQALAAELGGHTTFVRTDVTDEASVQAAIADATGKDRPLRIAVNCAGIGWAQRTVGRGGEPHDLGAFTTTVHGQPGRHVQRAPAGGRGDGGHRAGRGRRARGHRQHRLDRGLRRPDRPDRLRGVQGRHRRHDPAGRARPLRVGVRVCTIAPGLVDTPLLGSLPEEARQALSAGIPFPKRLGRPDDFAELALDIVRHGYLNGEVIRMDGALRMAPR